MMRSVAIIMACGALFSEPVAAHAASNDQPTVESVQAALVSFFKSSKTFQLRNYRSVSGDSRGWTMQRRITGARTVRRCYTVVETPVVVEQIDVAEPAAYYGIDWSQMESVKSPMGENLVFFARHMAENEGGMFMLDTEEEAEELAAAFEFMIAQC